MYGYELWLKIKEWVKHETIYTSTESTCIETTLYRNDQ